VSEERRRILEMLAGGKITASEAEQLLDALGPPRETENTQAPDGGQKAPRYLRVIVEGDKERVNVRVPLQLIRAGVKLGALMPKEARDKVEGALGRKGVQLDLGDIEPGLVEELIAHLADMSVDVEGEDGEKVRVFCE